MTKQLASCQSCRFWKVLNPEFHDGEPVGICRRCAPAPVQECQVTDGTDDDRAWFDGTVKWPITFENEWCGQFEPSDE